MKSEEDDRVVGDLSCRKLLDCMKALEEQGMEVKHLTRLATDKAYAKKVAECMIRGGVDMPLDYKIAKAIMHDNFFGVEDWERHFNVKFTKTMLAAAAKFPWDVDVLNSPCPFIDGKKIRETHIAFFGLDSDGKHPMRPRRVSMIYAPFGLMHFGIQPDRLEKQTCDLRWYLMPLYTDSLAMGGLMGETYTEKATRLPTGYEGISTIELMVKTLILRQQHRPYSSASHFICLDELDHGRHSCLSIQQSDDKGTDRLTLMAGWPSHDSHNAHIFAVSRKLPI